MSDAPSQRPGEVQPPSPGPPDSSRSAALPVFGIGALAFGLVLLVVAAFVDGHMRSQTPWAGALFSPDGKPPWEGAVAIQARHVPLNNFPLQRRVAFWVKDRLPPDDYRTLGLDDTEWLLSIEMPAESFEPLLASGRLPRPGRPEVLAGVYCRAEEIHVEDAYFRVVGRLKRGVGGLYGAYVLPANRVWDPLLMNTATWGWLDPDGRKHLLDQDKPAAFAEEHDIEGGIAPTQPAVIVLCMIALVSVATGGGLLHWVVFVSRSRHATGIFAPMFRATAAHPRLVRVLHLMLYGGFFVMMAAPLAYPFANVIMQNYITHTFSQGGLGYVGQAYQSGNIGLAAAATWVNNYLLQTVALTVISSLIIPLVGVLKTLVSFAMAGFGMTPIWSGMAGTLVFHSITMVLELEGYIFACVAVCVFWFDLVGGMRSGEGRARIAGAFKVLGAGTALSGVMLAIAALYEATTLILLH